MVELLKQLGQARGTTMVMVTHDHRILDRVDRILTLEDGRLVVDEVRPPSRAGHEPRRGKWLGDKQWKPQ